MKRVVLVKKTVLVKNVVCEGGVGEEDGVDGAGGVGEEDGVYEEGDAFSVISVSRSGVPRYDDYLRRFVLTLRPFAVSVHYRA